MTRTMAALLALVLAAPMAVAPATAQQQSAIGGLLGGSFFPFARAIGPEASPRCQRIANKMRSRRNDNILNVQDFRRLRSVGCQDVRPYDK